MYTIAEVITTTKQVKQIRTKELAAAVLDLKDETFVVYVASISQDLDVHSSQRV